MTYIKRLDLKDAFMFYLESFTFSALTLYVSVKSCLFIVGAESKLTERKTMKVSQKQMLSSLASWVPEILTSYWSTSGTIERNTENVG